MPSRAPAIVAILIAPIGDRRRDIVIISLEESGTRPARKPYHNSDPRPAASGPPLELRWQTVSMTIAPSVQRWVDEVRALTNPDRVVYCDGSDAERERLVA